MQNINPKMRDQADNNNTITVPGGVDANLLMNALTNPEIGELLISLAKTMKI